MKLEEQVVSLELSKQLKELGFKQKSLCYWIKGEMVQYHEEGDWEIKDSNSYFFFDKVGHDLIGDDFNIDATVEEEPSEEFNIDNENWIKWLNKVSVLREERLKDIIPAYSVAELLNIIGQEFAEIRSCNAGYEVIRNIDLQGKERFYSKDKNPANALAKMLIYLKENKLI